MKAPSVGRIVHYHSTSFPGEPLAAVITRVVDPEAGRVSLAVFSPGTAAPSAYRTVDYSETPEPTYWSWPPLQG